MCTEFYAIKKRIVFGITTIAVLFILALLLIFIIENKYVVKRNKHNYKLGNVSELTYDIESIEDYENQKGKIISGWIIEKNKRYSFFNYGSDYHGVGIYNNYKLCLIIDDNVYIFPTKLESRDDITKKINDGINYDRCGFTAYVNNKYTDMLDKGKIGVVISDMSGDEVLYELK